MAATLTQIAAASNVSVSLVSRLVRNDPTLRVSDSTRRRVLAAKAKLDEHPADQPRSAGARSRPRTFVASLAADFKQASQPSADSFQLYRLVQELEKQLAAQGHMLALNYFRDGGERERLVEQLADPAHPADGVIFLWDEVSRQAQQVILEQRLPHVVFHPSGEYEDLQTVRPLKEESFRSLVNHLIDLGHERIGYVGTQRKRYPWFAEAMVYACRPLDPAGLCRLDAEGPMQPWSDWRGAASRAFGVWLDQQQDWTAVVAENDFAALGVIDVLEARGLRVGQDFSVASYGNTEPALEEESSAVLTTIDEQLPRLARRMVAVLLEQIDQPRPHGIHELVPGKLVVRQSTGAA